MYAKSSSFVVRARSFLLGSLAVAQNHTVPESPNNHEYRLFGKKKAAPVTESRSVVGHVVDSDRNPVESAHVQLRPIPSGEARVVSSAADGAFSFSDLSRTKDYFLQGTRGDAKSCLYAISQHCSAQTVVITLTLKAGKGK
jgi:hypothetical protein